jgi:hypothetical protein
MDRFRVAKTTEPTVVIPNDELLQVLSKLSNRVVYRPPRGIKPGVQTRMNQPSGSCWPSLGLTYALRGTVKGAERFFSRSMRQVVHKGRTTLFQCIEIDRFIIGRVILPTPKDDTDPFERACPDGGLMGGALVALLLVVGTCPEGMPN